MLDFLPAVHRDPVAVRDAGQPQHRGRDAVARVPPPHPDESPSAQSEKHHQAAGYSSSGLFKP